MGLFDSVSSFVNDGGAIGSAMGGLDITGSNATARATQAQTDAANQANATQRYMYDTTRADMQPWRQAGVTALGQMQDPSFQHNFSASDFQADPGYAFRMAEGQKAIARAASAKGLFSTGSLKSLSDYNQNAASQEFTNAYNRFTNDQTNRFNRLGAIAGIGQTANAQIGQAGQNYANQVSANQTGLGNGIAAANIAQGNRTAGLIGQGAGAAAMMFSDERLKTNIQPIAKEDLNEMKSFLKAFHFNYTEKEFGEGDWMGVMAQDLEKSKLGKCLVVENEHGHKMLDTRKVMSLFLATMAEG